MVAPAPEGMEGMLTLAAKCAGGPALDACISLLSLVGFTLLLLKQNPLNSCREGRCSWAELEIWGRAEEEGKAPPAALHSIACCSGVRMPAPACRPWLHGHGPGELASWQGLGLYAPPGLPDAAAGHQGLPGWGGRRGPACGESSVGVWRLCAPVARHSSCPSLHFARRANACRQALRSSAHPCTLGPIWLGLETTSPWLGLFL